MRSNYKVNASAQFQVLSIDQVEEIHRASLEVLERVGVEVYYDEALALLKAAGAHVKGNRARIPSSLVEKALRTAPSRVTLSTRDGKRSVRLEAHNIYFGTGSDCPFILDSYTGVRRKVTKDDVCKAATICDALPNIDFVMSLGLVSDVPSLSSDRHQFEAMLMNTVKPIVFTAHDLEGYNDIVDMAAASVGGLEELQANPTICLYTEPISPLKHAKESVTKLLRTAQMRIPVVYTPCVMAGATVPATLAGALVTGNAESLSGMVIHQLKNPGAPFIIGGVYTIMDMQSTIFSYGAPEFTLLHAAFADLSHYYRKPIFSTAGCTDSKIVDEQAAIEAALSCLVAAQSGANLIHDVGYIEYGSTGSYEMLVMSDEIIGMVKRIVRGIEVNDDTLAVDVIDRVGPGGHFLSEEHTLRHFKNQTWFPRLIDRNRYDQWAAMGATTMGERTKAKVQEILATHKPLAVPDAGLKAIEGIVSRADAKYKE
ncbi:MAG: trimethylamine methyltransferase family protein [Bacillota bacterium]